MYKKKPVLNDVFFSPAENMRGRYNEILVDKQRLEQANNSLRLIMEDERKELADLRRQQQELINSTTDGGGGMGEDNPPSRKSRSPTPPFDHVPPPIGQGGRSPLPCEISFKKRIIIVEFSARGYPYTPFAKNSDFSTFL